MWKYYKSIHRRSCGNTRLFITTHITNRNLRSRRKMSQPSLALHVLLIHKLNYKLFDLTHTENKSLFHVSLEGSEQQNNSVFFSSSWESSCTMFILRTAALNESRHTAALWYLTLGWVTFLSYCVTWRKGEMGTVRNVVNSLHYAFTCTSKMSPRPPCQILILTVTISVRVCFCVVCVSFP